jgi:hypothetical protein
MDNIDDKILELRDILVVEDQHGKESDFEVVGLVEEEIPNTEPCEFAVNYAVCYNEDKNDFIITDAYGVLIDDEKVSLDVLDSYFDLSEFQ